MLGVAGKDGKVGPAGKDGKDGKAGVDGKAGPAGKDGKAGADGKLGDDENLLCAMCGRETPPLAPARANGLLGA